VAEIFVAPDVRPCASPLEDTEATPGADEFQVLVGVTDWVELSDNVAVADSCVVAPTLIDAAPATWTDLTVGAGVLLEPPQPQQSEAKGATTVNALNAKEIFIPILPKVSALLHGRLSVRKER
jgi:hypothetical protein